MPKKPATLFSPILCLALFILPVLFTSGCRSSEEKHVRQTLERAEKLMWTHADSSLLALQSVADFSMRGETQARYALLLTQALNRNEQLPTSDSLIRIAVDYYDNSSDSLRKAWGNYYMAVFCMDNNRKDESVKYFQKAEIAGNKTGDKHFLGLLYDNWGYLLLGVQPYEESLRLSMKALSFYEEENDSAYLIYNYRNIARAYSYLDNRERSITYLGKSIDMALQLKQTDKLFLLYFLLSQQYEFMKAYDESMKYLQEAQRYMEKGNISQQKNIRTQKAFLFKDMQQYDSAAYYQSLLDTTDLIDRAIYHVEMSEIRKGQGDYRNALFHQERYAQCLDSFYIDRETEKIAEIQKKYDYSRILYENEKLTSTSRLWSNVALLIMLLLIIVSAIAFYFHNKSKQKIREAIHKKNEIISQNRIELQQKTNEMLMQQQVLQEKEQDLRLAIERQKGLEQKLKESSQEDTEMEQLSELMAEQKALKERIFHANEVVKKIEKLKQLNAIQKRSKKSDLLLSPEECKELYEAVNYTYNNMESFLRENYPLLSEGDIFICCLLRMEVSNGDICLLTGSSEAALKKRKYRIKHDKMKNTEEGVSLDDILKRI